MRDDFDTDNDPDEVIAVNIRLKQEALVKVIRAWAYGSEDDWLEHVISKQEPCGCTLDNDYGNEYCDEWRAEMNRQHAVWLAEREAERLKRITDPAVVEAERRRHMTTEELARELGIERFLP